MNKHNFDGPTCARDKVKTFREAGQRQHMSYDAIHGQATFLRADTISLRLCLRRQDIQYAQHSIVFIPNDFTVVHSLSAASQQAQRSTQATKIRRNNTCSSLNALGQAPTPRLLPITVSSLRAEIRFQSTVMLPFSMMPTWMNLPHLRTISSPNDTESGEP